MSVLSRFRIIAMSEKKAATHELIERATPDFDFFFMVALAVIMACVGMMQGSETVVIGSMLIAPMLYPVLSVSLGLATGDLGILRRSLATLGNATLLSIGVGLVAGLFGAAQPVAHLLTPEIIFRTEPTLFSLAVAVVSGLAVAYALMRPRLSETLAGIAISVSLIPPLAVVGLGLAWFNLPVAVGALAVFLLNIAGIIAAALIVFALTDLKGMDREAHEAVKEEEERIRKETAKLEKLDKIETA
jgi:uncharacterized hydrophobic protein (TIGR00271 family)